MPRKALNSSDFSVPIPGFTQVVEAPADGRLLFVSGLTSRNHDGEVVGDSDVQAQTRQVLRNLSAALEAAGSGLEDVVQIRTYVRHIQDWPRIEQVWREFWSEPWPASTLVEVSRLSDARQLVETDAIAVAPHRSEGSAAHPSQPHRRRPRPSEPDPAESSP